MNTPADKPDLHWYAVDKHGIATLCVDEQDAIEAARENTALYPQNAPYVAMQLVDSRLLADERRKALEEVREIVNSPWSSFKKERELLRLIDRKEPTT